MELPLVASDLFFLRKTRLADHPVPPTCPRTPWNPGKEANHHETMRMFFRPSSTTSLLSYKQNVCVCVCWAEKWKCSEWGQRTKEMLLSSPVLAYRKCQTVPGATEWNGYFFIIWVFILKAKAFYCNFICITFFSFLHICVCCTCVWGMKERSWKKWNVGCKMLLQRFRCGRLKSFVFTSSSSLLQALRDVTLRTKPHISVLSLQLFYLVKIVSTWTQPKTLALNQHGLMVTWFASSCSSFEIPWENCYWCHPSWLDSH